MSPTIIVVPGATQPPIFYQPFIEALQKEGFSAKVVSLPSTGADHMMETFDEDVTAVQRTVVGVLEEGLEVVVVMHSYGGIPGSAAMRDLGKAQRTKAGKAGGVVRLVYAASFLLREGDAMPGKGDYESMRAGSVIDEKAGTMVLKKEVAMLALFHDLPAAEAEHWVPLLKPQSIGATWSTQTYAAWKDIPSTYVKCENDRVVPIDLQESMIANAREVQSAFDVVEKLECGHEPFLSNIGNMVAIMKKATGTNKKK